MYIYIYIYMYIYVYINIPGGMRYLWEIPIRSPLRETSQRPLRNISKRCLLCNIFKISGISQKRCLFRDVSVTSHKHLSQVFLVFQKYPTRMISCDFRKVITISDKIDVEPLETLKKWKVFWKQSSVMSISGLMSVRVLTSQRLSNLSGSCIIYYF